MVTVLLSVVGATDVNVTVTFRDADVELVPQLLPEVTVTFPETAFAA